MGQKKRTLKEFISDVTWVSLLRLMSGKMDILLFTAGDGELETTPKGQVPAMVCLMAVDFISEECCKHIALFCWETFRWYLRWGVKKPLYSGEDESRIVSVSVKLETVWQTLSHYWRGQIMRNKNFLDLLRERKKVWWKHSNFQN